jgi:hypothetical protein
MKLGRLGAAAFALVAFGASAEAGNGSNYIHLINGIDYFFGKAPVSGNFNGIWRCFPADTLYSPTKVVDPAGTVAPGNYATKVCAVHVSVAASANKVVTFPTLTLSSGDGDCAFLNAGTGGLNYGLGSIGGFGTFVVGPNNGPSGTVNLLAAVGNLTVLNTWGGAGPTGATVAALFFNLSQIFGSPSTIAVPEGESLVVWLQDDPNQFGPGQIQYWTGSNDERNICSSFSFLLSGSGSAFAFLPNFEWCLTIGTLDATLNQFVFSLEALGLGGNGGTDAMAVSTLAQPGDQGTGMRTISITGTDPFQSGGSIGSEIIGWNVYDENNPFGGSNRLTFINLWSLDIFGNPYCALGNHLNAPNQLVTPTGGPGGAPMSTLIPQEPRFVGQVDAVSNALLKNGLWLNFGQFAVTLAGINFPHFPAAAGISGGSGNTGGAAFTVPPLASVIGVELFAWNVNLTASGTAIAKTANNGHSHTNGSPWTFHP